MWACVLSGHWEDSTDEHSQVRLFTKCLYLVNLGFCLGFSSWNYILIGSWLNVVFLPGWRRSFPTLCICERRMLCSGFPGGNKFHQPQKSLLQKHMLIWYWDIVILQSINRKWRNLFLPHAHILQHQVNYASNKIGYMGRASYFTLMVL